MAPSQAGEPAEVAIRGDPIASRLDRQRGEVGIRYQIAFDARGPAESREDVPVAAAGLDRHAVRLHANDGGETGRGFDGRGLLEHLRVGHDPEEAAENQVGDAVWLLAGEQVTEPGGVVLVSRGVEAMGVDEDVDVNDSPRQRA